MPPSANPALISFIITGIPSVNKKSRDQYLTLKSVLTRVIHHPFVIVCGFHESKDMTKTISDIEFCSLITDCEGAWGSLLLFVTKPHQESCNDINAFIWRLYVSYPPLNCVILVFEFCIPCCADSIKDLGDSCGSLFMISLDARSGYHQIMVRESDPMKLSFFAPGRRKKTF